MATSTVRYSGGMGLATPLTVLFVALKLTGVISWSWLWVLAPLWISFGISMILLASIGVMFYLIAKRGGANDLLGSLRR